MPRQFFVQIADYEPFISVRWSGGSMDASRVTDKNKLCLTQRFKDTRVYSLSMEHALFLSFPNKDHYGKTDCDRVIEQYLLSQGFDLKQYYWDGGRDHSSGVFFVFLVHQKVVHALKGYPPKWYGLLSRYCLESDYMAFYRLMIHQLGAIEVKSLNVVIAVFESHWVCSLYGKDWWGLQARGEYANGCFDELWQTVQATFLYQGANDMAGDIGSVFVVSTCFNDGDLSCLRESMAFNCVLFNPFLAHWWGNRHLLLPWKHLGAYWGWLMGVALRGKLCCN